MIPTPTSTERTRVYVRNAGTSVRRTELATITKTEM